MKAIRKKPGCEPELIDIDNTLKALQQEVGGYIEAVTLPYGAALICNEEGRISACRTTAVCAAWMLLVRCSLSVPRARSSATCRRPTS